MRVIVEIDPEITAGVATVAALTAAAERPMDTMDTVDGGGSPDSMAGGSSETHGSADTGGPPQWLLDDVARAIAAGDDTVAVVSTGVLFEKPAGAQDGGAGPN